MTEDQGSMASRAAESGSVKLQLEGERAPGIASVNGHAPALYVDDLAERLKARAGEPYQPSSGTEGELFQQGWCERCQRDQAFRIAFQSNQDADGCEILADTMVYSPSDPDYPRQWQYSTLGQPICTAFVPISTTPPPPDPQAEGDKSRADLKAPGSNPEGEGR